MRRAPHDWRDWFRGPLSYSESVEGNSVRDSGEMILGLRSGPEVCVSALVHEMAHFIEIDDSRAFSTGWGLEFRIVEIMGHSCCEPTTCQGLLREVRVCAIQMQLSSHFGMSPDKADLEYTVKSLRHLPDYCMGFAHYGISGFHDADLHGPIWDDVQKRSQALEIPALWAEWNRKLGLSSFAGTGR